MEQQVQTGSSGNVLYMKEGEAFVRVSPHCCHCDECKLLDKHDERTLEICWEYIDEKVDKDTWWSNLCAHTYGGNVKRPIRDHMPVNLGEEVQFVAWDYSSLQSGEPCEIPNPPTEKDLKSWLHYLLIGYEVRQRLKHKWGVVKNPVS